NLSLDLDYTDIADKFEKWAKLAGKANAAYADICLLLLNSKRAKVLGMNELHRGNYKQYLNYS
ncbi:hypothetical protein, partial [Kingella kingae]|uniref:hypothetical protein n=1 Tax=Kingella kingae TaxID=504 RepID=UPI001E53E7C7